jgi:hypothetical protein
VVYASDTGHVLGALAPNGPVGDAPAVSQLIGDAMPLWVTGKDGRPLALPVPAHYLGSAVVNDLAGVVTVPLGFGVELTNGTPRPDLQALSPPTDATGPLLPPPRASVTVAVTATQVTVRVPDPADTALPVLLVLSGPDGPQPPMTGAIGSGSESTTFTVSLATGDPYAALALVKGRRGVATGGSVS